MNVYHYDAETGEFVGATIAQEDPKDPGKYLVPANATVDAPPAPAENQSAVFRNGTWSKVADYRGTKYYDAEGVEHTIHTLGKTVPVDATTTPPPGPDYVLQAGAWVPAPITSEQVNQERTRRLAAGAIVGVTGHGDVAVQGRPQDIDNLNALALAATLRLQNGDAAHLTTFRDRDNVDHDLTPIQVIELWQKSAAHAEAIFKASWALKGGAEIPQDYTSDAYWP